MLKSVAWLSCAFAFTFLVGPVAFIASQSGQQDAADLYVVVEVGAQPLSQETLVVFGARDVGPVRSVLAKMILAPPAARERLLDAGYILLPASALAALCGIETAGYSTSLRNV
ncbi:hypothetical protein [Roseobacter sp.]|uniref:hypothetical protein n=1 Tax=Roseobacter sp. TaxID=1907202 RepID=UPI0032970DF9